MEEVVPSVNREEAWRVTDAARCPFLSLSWPSALAHRDLCSVWDCLQTPGWWWSEAAVSCAYQRWWSEQCVDNMPHSAQIHAHSEVFCDEAHTASKLPKWGSVPVRRSEGNTNTSAEQQHHTQTSVDSAELPMRKVHLQQNKCLKAFQNVWEPSCIMYCNSIYLYIIIIYFCNCHMKCLMLKPPVLPSMVKRNSRPCLSLI